MTMGVSEVGCRTKSLIFFTPNIMKNGKANQTGQVTVPEIYQCIDIFGIKKANGSEEWKWTIE